MSAHAHIALQHAKTSRQQERATCRMIVQAEGWLAESSAAVGSACALYPCEMRHTLVGDTARGWHRDASKAASAPMSSYGSTNFWPPCSKRPEGLMNDRRPRLYPSVGLATSAMASPGREHGTTMRSAELPDVMPYPLRFRSLAAEFVIMLRHARSSLGRPSCAMLA